MAYSTRREDIVRIVQLVKRVSVQELAQRFHVSEATVRKDLAFLEDQAVAVRTHGGAVLAEPDWGIHNVQDRKRVFMQEKQAIARMVRTLVVQGETVFLDSGSTCTVVAREIRDMHLRVLCHSVGVINELINARAISLISLGGSYRQRSGSFIGPLTCENLRRFHIETCFVGTAGFSLDGVFCAQNMIEAQLKTEVLKSSTRRIVVADHSKINRMEYAVFARAHDVDILIVDECVSPQDREALAKLDVEVLYAKVERSVDDRRCQGRA